MFNIFPAAFAFTIAVTVYVTVLSPTIVNKSFIVPLPDGVFPTVKPTPVSLDVYDQLLNALIDVPPASVVVWFAKTSFMFRNDIKSGLFTIILYVIVPPGIYVVSVVDFVITGVPDTRLVNLPICDKFTVEFDFDIPVANDVLPLSSKLAVKFFHASYWSPYAYDGALSLSHIIIDVLLSASVVVLIESTALPDVLLFCILNSPGDVNVIPVVAFMLALDDDVFNV